MSNINYRNYDDRVSMSEEHNIDHFKESRKNIGTTFYTEVEIKNELGEKIFTRNETVLAGKLFVLGKISNITPPIRIPTLNQKFNVLPDEEVFVGGFQPEKCIVGFNVGIGGSGDVFKDRYDVKIKENQVPDMIPFRQVLKTNDLRNEERDRYFLKVEDGDFYKYYGKTFETAPKIKVEFDEPGKPAVPYDVHLSDKNTIINSYVEYHLKISVDDCREFFKFEAGGIDNARINSFGLVIGYPDTSLDYKEYKGLQQFTIINTNNDPLTQESRELYITYKIYS